MQEVFIRSAPAEQMLLMHFDGPDGSKIIVDDGGVNATSVIVGPTSIRTTKSKFGVSSISRNTGAETNVKITSATDMIPTGPEDYTIEFWYCVDTATAGAVFPIMEYNSLKVSYHTGYKELIMVDGWSVNTSAAINLNTWYHIAFVRKNGIVRVYFDGVLKATATYSVDFVKSTLILFNRGNLPTYVINDFIDELRITKRAVYEGPFTPPTTPFTF